jgi:hypothetical protein
MREPLTQVRFPAVSFASHAEFVAYCAASRSLLDARYLHERSLALAPGVHAKPGTCAPCLREARFTLSTENGERLENDRVVPNWREQMVCDCEDRLNNRHRAVLHFIESEVTLAPWQRVLAFGRLSDAEMRLCRRLGAPLFVPRLTVRGARPPGLAAPDAGCHLALALDYLHQVPPLPAALAELRRALVPGGVLVFTVPFRWDRPTTRTHADATQDARLPVESPREVHEIGWDILDRLREAGFARSRVHSYWSEELGYLGPFNTIFSAET